MSPVKGVAVAWKFDDVHTVNLRGWYPVGTATLDVPFRRGQMRRLWRWIQYPDQAPTKRPVPIKGRR